MPWAAAMPTISRTVAQQNPAMVEFLQRVCPPAEQVMTVCSGSGLLARTGLLDGRRATTNKAYFAQCSGEGPNVNWVKEARWVEDGPYATSSGVSAGIDMALAAGVNKKRIWIDPGIGFGKTFEHNLELLRRLRELRSLGCPVPVGTSRKAFIGRILAPLRGGEIPPHKERVVGTGATVAMSIANGADIVRVHDVAHTVEVARVADAIVRGWHAARKT